MKTLRLLLFLSMMICATDSAAQVPEAINYQAVLRGANAAPIVSLDVLIRVVMHDSDIVGPIIFTQDIQTNTGEHGIINIKIGDPGDGSPPPIPSLATAISVNVALAKVIEIFIDTTNTGNNFESMGTQQLVSVPFSIYSDRAVYADSAKFTGILIDTEFKMFRTDSTVLEPVFTIDQYGNSYQKGKQNILGGITIGDVIGRTINFKPSGVINGTDSIGVIKFYNSVDSGGYFKDSIKSEGPIITNGTGASRVMLNPDGTILSRNSSNDTIFFLNADGTSYHKGKEVFANGTISGDSTKAHVRINPDGSIAIKNAAGQDMFSVDSTGKSFHKNQETFEGEIIIGTPNGSKIHITPDGEFYGVDNDGRTIFVNTTYSELFSKYGLISNGEIIVSDTVGAAEVRIRPDGSIISKNSSGEIIFRLNSDGTSYHKGKEVFANGTINGDSTKAHVRINPDGSIAIKNAAGQDMFSVDSTGKSFHKNQETFEGEIIIGAPNGSKIHITPEGEIYGVDNDGRTIFANTTYSESFSKYGLFSSGEIIVSDTVGAAEVRLRPDGSIISKNSSGEIIFRLNTDGTSYHKGKEVFANGTINGDSTKAHVRINPDGSIAIKNAAGQDMFRVDSTGKSFHKNTETFEGDIIVGDINGAFIQITPGDVIGYDSNGESIFAHSTYSPGYSKFGIVTEGAILADGIGPAGVSIRPDGSILSKNSSNDTIFLLNADGTSYHKGLEVYANGIHATGGTITGNGSGVSAINASNISTGTVGDSRLSTNVPFKNTSNTFILPQTINVPGGVALTCTGPMTGGAGQFNGNVNIIGGFLGAALQSSSSAGTAGQFNGNVNINGGLVGPAFQSSSSTGPAGQFNGSVEINGDLNVTGNVIKGGGTFRIDHPLDPENKFLNHSFVESPDMMNIYNGNAEIGDDGKVTVKLPEWFDALNMDFRYQLTCIGGFAPVYIEKVISENAFTIGGGVKGLIVSWQVTGIRQDDYAKNHRVIVEENKPESMRGKLLHSKE